MQVQDSCSTEKIGQKGVSGEDLKSILNKCLGISPQFTKDLISKLNIECKCAI
jgi:hypothetical protein